MADSEPLNAATEVPGEFLDVTGNMLRRRMNLVLFVGVGVFLLGIGILVALTYSNIKLNAVGTAVADVKARLMGLSSASSTVNVPPSIASAAANLVQSPAELAQLLALFSCPSGQSVPRKWIILGDSFLRSESVTPSWHSVLSTLLGYSNVETLVPPGNTLGAQLAWLQAQPAGNASQFGLWQTAREPLLVFVSYGYQELLGTLTADPRAQSLPVLTAQVYGLLRADWLDSSRNRLVVVVPGVAYSPVQFFLPSTRHACTDSLAASLYNSPSSLQVQPQIQQATLQSIMPYAIASLSAETAASTQFVLVDSLTSKSFTWSASDDAQVAYADDCLSLNAKGQRLLAQYLKACLSGDSFSVPTSLNEK